MADRDDLRKRADALRLTNKQIAAKADLDPNTITRLFRGDNVLLSTIDAVARVIKAEELQQLARLTPAVAS